MDEDAAAICFGPQRCVVDVDQGVHLRDPPVIVIGLERDEIASRGGLRAPLSGHPRAGACERAPEWLDLADRTTLAAIFDGGVERQRTFGP
jgi:hypothetical protein